MLDAIVTMVISVFYSPTVWMMLRVESYAQIFPISTFKELWPYAEGNKGWKNKRHKRGKENVKKRERKRKREKEREIFFKVIITL